MENRVLSTEIHFTEVLRTYLLYKVMHICINTMRKEAIGNENQNFKKRRYQELKGKGSMYFYMTDYFCNYETLRSFKNIKKPFIYLKLR